MDFPLVSVVILNYKNKELTLNCVRSVLALTYPPDKLEIIVADNGSHDGSVESFHQEFPTIKIMPFDTNLGIPKPYNAAIKDARGEFILRLDNDVELTPNSLQEMLHIFATKKDAGIASARMNYLNDKTRIFFDGIKFNSFLLLKLPHENRKIQPIMTTDFIPACVVLFKKSLWQELNGLDENYFCYWEDVDFSYRAEKRGYKSYYTTQTLVYHGLSATSAKMGDLKYKLDYESKFYFIKKNYPSAHACFLALFHLTLVSFVNWLFYQEHFFIKIKAFLKIFFRYDIRN